MATQSKSNAEFNYTVRFLEEIPRPGHSHARIIAIRTRSIPMSPRIQLALSISAIIFGFTLVAALIYGGDIASQPLKFFLGTLLLTGGMMFLWKKWTLPQPEKAEPEIPRGPIAPATPAAPEALAAPAPLAPIPDALSVEPEMSDEQFLARFLKK
jgi:hypothetical protein